MTEQEKPDLYRLLKEWDYETYRKAIMYAETLGINRQNQKEI